MDGCGVEDGIRAAPIHQEHRSARQQRLRSTATPVEAGSGGPVMRMQRRTMMQAPAAQTTPAPINVPAVGYLTNQHMNPAPGDQTKAGVPLCGICLLCSKASDRPGRSIRCSIRALLLASFTDVSHTAATRSLLTDQDSCKAGFAALKVAVDAAAIAALDVGHPSCAGQRRAPNAARIRPPQPGQIIATFDRQPCTCAQAFEGMPACHSLAAARLESSMGHVSRWTAVCHHSNSKTGAGTGRALDAQTGPSWVSAQRISPVNVRRGDLVHAAGAAHSRAVSRKSTLLAAQAFKYEETSSSVQHFKALQCGARQQSQLEHSNS